VFNLYNFKVDFEKKAQIVLFNPLINWERKVFVFFLFQTFNFSCIKYNMKSDLVFCDLDLSSNVFN